MSILFRITVVLMLCVEAINMGVMTKIITDKMKDGKNKDRFINLSCLAITLIITLVVIIIFKL